MRKSSACTRPNALDDPSAVVEAKRHLILPVLLGLVAMAWLSGCGQSPDAQVAAHRELVQRYCADCHNPLDREGDLVLEEAGVADPAAAPAVWEAVSHKIRVGLMPPPGRPRPDAARLDAFVEHLETSLDAAAAAAPQPGRMPIHRLSRSQYGNAIRDLLGFELDIESLLPADSSTHGFDNISDVLKTSPLLLERYLTVGLRIAALAVGDTTLEPRTAQYQPPADLSQNEWIEGLPLGTRGGLIVRHYFPVDGEYELRPLLWEAAASTVRGLEGFETPFEFEILLNEEPVHRAELGGLEDDALSNRDQGSATAAANERIRTRLAISAGEHELGFTFRMRSFALDQRLLQPWGSDLPPGNDAYGWPRVLRVLVTGPFNASGSGDSTVRRNLFICRPSDGVSHVDCAERILGRIALRAYSRPLGEDDLSVLLDLYREGSRDGRDFDRGIQLALARILSGPEFLFRPAAAAPSGTAPGEPYPLDDVALASRLALFLWNSIPDDELLDAALAGRLADDAELERQVRRMLVDARARTLVTSFAAQWLQLASVRGKTPDLLTFPSWDANLRNAMLRETELLLEHVLLGNRNVLELIDADYTFLNERLARHYGINGVFGDAFRRVSLEDPERRGLLGHGSILFLTSEATRTSPVLRGKWVMSNFFNAPPAPPPPNVPALEAAEGAGEVLSIRKQLERHSSDPVCAGCHATMDPAGFALEPFDAVGRWRESDAGQPVDSSAVLPDGTDIGSPAALRQALMDRPEIFVGTLASKLMTYALARGLEPEDMPAVRRVVRDAAQADYRFGEIVLGVVRSVPFRMKQEAAESSSSRAEHALSTLLEQQGDLSRGPSSLQTPPLNSRTRG